MNTLEWQFLHVHRPYYQEKTSQPLQIDLPQIFLFTRPAESGIDTSWPSRSRTTVGLYGTFG